MSLGKKYRVNRIKEIGRGFSPRLAVLLRTLTALSVRSLAANY
jgi:hypothetical protein